MYQRFLAGSRSGGWAGFGAGCATAHVVAHVCPSSTSVPRAASAASSCSCKQRCVASPVGPWAGGARAGLTGAVRGAAAAHAIDAVLLLHHERQHVVLHLPGDRHRPWRRVVHLVVRRARMFERAWRGSMEWGRVPPPRAARRARAATRPGSCVCARAQLPACMRFIVAKRGESLLTRAGDVSGSRGRRCGRGGVPAVGGSQVRRAPVTLLPTYLSSSRIRRTLLAGFLFL